ncbi:Dbl homology domain-containing protein [Gongronella butleri]|nr:Dbl homology domain-containing protein [Gongronella butleri]
MTSYPPPPLFAISFETVEARLWATETIDQVFLDTAPSAQCFSLDKASATVPRAQKPLPPLPPVTTCQIGPRRACSDDSLTVDRDENDHLRRSASPASYSSHSSTSTGTNDDASTSTLLLSGHGTPPLRRSTPTMRSASSASSSSTSSSYDGRSVSAKSDPGLMSASLASFSSASTAPRRSRLTLKRHLTLDDGKLHRLFTPEHVQRERRAVQLWREILNGYLLDTTFAMVSAPRPSTKMTYCLISELLSTEQTYLGHLTSFKQVFIDPFTHDFQSRFMIRDLQLLFSYFPALITLSTELVRQWQASMDRQLRYMGDRIALKDIQPIGKAFCDLEHEFNVYTHYAMQYTRAQKCITRLERKPTYQQWMHATLHKKEINRMSLADYLISPVQRITRYCLLVKDLMKYSERVDPNLERSLKSLSALAMAMNNCQQ